MQALCDAGLLHSIGGRFPGRYHDFIAIPMPIWYQSLQHDAVARVDTSLKVQIRRGYPRKQEEDPPHTESTRPMKCKARR